MHMTHSYSLRDMYVHMAYKCVCTYMYTLTIAANTQLFLCVKHYAEFFTFTNSLTPHSKPLK